MKNSSHPTYPLLLKRAHPLPLLAAGFLVGLAVAALSHSELALAPLSFPDAFAALLSVELPIWGLTALFGLCRLPFLTALPLCYRALVWGYGSLRLYLAAGKSALYFHYIWGVGLTLLPLCCMAKLAEKNASSPGQIGENELTDYLCRSLFFFGLTLITILLRCGLHVIFPSRWMI